MNNMTNGRTRKNLADQIDRLDSILNGLPHALKEATAHAVQQALETTLTQLLSNPELMSLISGARLPVPVTQPAPVPSSPPTASTGRIGSALSWANQKIHSAREACSRKLSGIRPRLLGLWQLRRQMLIALGVGGVAGLVAYAAGPLAAGALGAVAGFTTALAARARRWVKQMLATAQFASAPLEC